MLQEQRSILSKAPESAKKMPVNRPQVLIAEEARNWLPRLLTVMLMAFGVLSGVTFLEGVFSAFGTPGTPQELVLKAENRALRQQLARTEQSIATMAGRLDALAESDRELYRTILEAGPLTGDIQKAGVGGSDPYRKFDRFSEPSASLLRGTARRLDEMERRIRFQAISFGELNTLAKEHSEALAQMPAIVPADGPIVSGFGLRYHAILRVEKMHEGIDVLVDEGTPVVATGDGEVRLAGLSATYGNVIDIEHPAAGYITRYAHLGEIGEHIQPGAKVQRGEQIGLSGTTGLSTGPHLHYEVMDLEESALDPMQFLVPNMTPKHYQYLKATEGFAASMD